MAVVWDGTAPGTEEHVLGPGQPHAHIENPDWPGIALCLTPITGTRTGSGDCPECARLLHANRTWIAR